MIITEAFHRGVLLFHTAVTGRHILASLDELNRTQWLDHHNLMDLQRVKLQQLLEYAYQYVPYYRRTFDQVGFIPGNLIDDPASFQKIPILNKSLIRESFLELQTTDPPRRRQLSKVTTSGSTGQPLIFMQDHTFRDNVTADIQRHLGWAGWKMGQSHAYIWGANFEETPEHKFRTRLIDWEWNRFLTNAFTLTDEKMAAFAERVRRQHPRILFGYASSLLRFAQFVRQRQYRDITFDGIISSAEVLPSGTRQVIEETFKGRVFNRYGTKELGGIACECEAHNGLHVSAENNLVEILCDGRTARQGEIGSFIVTNLNNWGMPFIRYSIGDEGSWDDSPSLGDSDSVSSSFSGSDRVSDIDSSSFSFSGSPSVSAKCSCGRSSPRLKAVEGRIVDQFVTRDGRSSWAGFAGDGYSSLLAQPSIKQFQIIQESLDKITVLIVREAKDGEIPSSILSQLEMRLRTAFGEDIVVEFQFPDQISLLPSGKHQYAISRISSNVSGSASDSSSFSEIYIQKNKPKGG